jgi:hypothetical protein
MRTGCICTQSVTQIRQLAAVGQAMTDGGSGPGGGGKEGRSLRAERQGTGRSGGGTRAGPGAGPVRRRRSDGDAGQHEVGARRRSRHRLWPPPGQSGPGETRRRDRRACRRGQRPSDGYAPFLSSLPSPRPAAGYASFRPAASRFSSSAPPPAAPAAPPHTLSRTACQGLHTRSRTSFRDSRARGRPLGMRYLSSRLPVSARRCAASAAPITLSSQAAPQRPPASAALVSGSKVVTVSGPTKLQLWLLCSRRLDPFDYGFY